MPLDALDVLSADTESVFQGGGVGGTYASGPPTGETWACAGSLTKDLTRLGGPFILNMNATDAEELPLVLLLQKESVPDIWLTGEMTLVKEESMHVSS